LNCTMMHGLANLKRSMFSLFTGSCIMNLLYKDILYLAVTALSPYHIYGKVKCGIRGIGFSPRRFCLVCLCVHSWLQTECMS